MPAVTELQASGDESKSGPSPAAASTYMPQLDGVRAVAVVLVIVSHWLPGALPPAITGPTGVRLFFSISGMLITGILLDARLTSERDGRPLGHVVKSFFARRAIRILPVYYATLLVLSVLGLDALTANVGWHLAYASNVLFAVRGHWDGEVSHLWSLSVEEQFYLIWPWFILFVPRRLLTPFVVLAIVLGPLSRGVFLTLGWEMAATTLTPTALDSLGLGALFAVLSRAAYRPARAPSIAAAAAFLGVFGGAIWLISAIWPPRSVWLISLAQFGESCALAWVVVQASVGFRGPAGWFLKRPTVLYVGRVSYGLYLFHMFMPALSLWTFRQAGVAEPKQAALLGVALLFLVGLSSASWELFEGPVNRFKHRFAYVPDSRTESSPETPLVVQQVT